MQTLLVQKDQLDELDMLKKDYFNTILQYQTDCLRHFQAKNREKTLDSLSKLAETASYAYDLEILKEASFLQGMVCVFFCYWNEAIKHFKNAVRIFLSLNSL